jgi:hypothetical protein
MAPASNTLDSSTLQSFEQIRYGNAEALLKGDRMMKLLVAAIFVLTSMLAVTAAAQEPTMPHGLDWKALSSGEQLAYAQGFVDGQSTVLLFLPKDKMLACKPALSEGCLILKWWANIRYVPDFVQVVATMNVFYSDARNLCVSEPNAFLISEAMAQGDTISDLDLAAIRKGDVELDAKYHNHQP